MNPYYFGNPVTVTTAKRFDPPSFPAANIGWTICVYGNTRASLTYISISYKKSGGYLRAQIYFGEDQNPTSTYCRINDANNAVLSQEQFGTNPHFNDIAGLNINFTLMAFTQLRVELARPGYPHVSALTQLTNVNLMGDIDHIHFQANGMDEVTFNFDCK